MSNIIKTVTRRDSATAILRKLGIKPRDYNLFIAETADKQFAVKVGAAEKHLADLAGPSEEELKLKAEQAAEVESLRTKLVRKVKSNKADKASKEAFRDAQVVANPTSMVPTDKESLTSYAKRVILAGHTNAELWAALVEHFNTDDKKRGYPAYYRFVLRKEGHEV